MERKHVKKEDNDTDDEESSESSEMQLPVKKMKVSDYLKTSLSPSKSTSVQPEVFLKIGNTIFVNNGQILEPKEKLLTGKIVTDGWDRKSTYIWKVLPTKLQKAPPKEVAPYLPGTIGAAREIQTELAAFQIYVTESMLTTILQSTNEQMQLSDYYMYPKPKCNYPITLTELNAFIGILYLAAVKKDNKISTSFLWGVSGSDIYNAVMSKERFEYLIQCLRFDDYITRAIRRERDPFTDIRGVWEQFMNNCSEVFRPSINCTMDDIFVDFNGQCNFKYPLTKKTDKHGMKLLLLCDTHYRYIMSGIPHLNNSDNIAVPTAEYMIQELTKPIRGTNVNITCGKNSYNSVPLAKQMNYNKLTTVGLLDANNNEIPPDLIQTENRPVGSSIFVHNIEDNLQLCTYYPNNGNINILLSSMHFESAINEADGKPKALEYFESTKDAVDKINDMFHGLSCSRRTSQWFVALFYTILDFAGINSFTILNLNKSRVGIPSIRRIDFLYKLSLDLMLPFMKERLKDPAVEDSVKNKIISAIEERQKLNFVSNQPKYTWRQTNVKLTDINSGISGQSNKQNTLNIKPEVVIQDIFTAPSNQAKKPKKEVKQVTTDQTTVVNASTSVTDTGSSNRSYKAIVSISNFQLTSNKTQNQNNRVYNQGSTPYGRPGSSQKRMWDQIHRVVTSVNSRFNESNVAMMPFYGTYTYQQNGMQFQLLPPSLSIGWIAQNFLMRNMRNLLLSYSILEMQRASYIQQKMYFNNLRQFINNMLTPPVGRFLVPILPIKTHLNIQNKYRPILPTNSMLNCKQTSSKTAALVPTKQSAISATPSPSSATSSMSSSATPSPSSSTPSTSPCVNPQKAQAKGNAKKCVTFAPIPPALREPSTSQPLPASNVVPKGKVSALRTRPVISTSQSAASSLKVQQKISTLQTAANISNPNDSEKELLTACGVCNFIANKSLFIECGKCFVTLCNLHRNIICTTCFDLNRSVSTYNLASGKVSKCGLCNPKKKSIVEFSIQCGNCSKFLCLDHRRFICCFCN